MPPLSFQNCSQCLKIYTQPPTCIQPIYRLEKHFHLTCIAIFILEKFASIATATFLILGCLCCFPVAEGISAVFWAVSIAEVKLLSRVQLFAIPLTVAYQVPPSMAFSRQEYWSGLPFPSPGDLPDPGNKPRSPTLWSDALPSEPPREAPISRGHFFSLMLS